MAKPRIETRMANWNSFTKAELIRTVKILAKRETTLLNQIAKLQRVADDAEALLEHLRKPDAKLDALRNEALRDGALRDEATQGATNAFPWETK